jgi:hypothetical protein
MVRVVLPVRGIVKVLSAEGEEATVNMMQVFQKRREGHCICGLHPHTGPHDKIEAALFSKFSKP